jgi:RNA polymerase sigma-70 factor, ECF subfamily
MKRLRLANGGGARTLGEMPPLGLTDTSAFLDDADEAALVARAQRGGEDAFAALVARYGAMVMSLAYASTLSRSDAEDVTQETFIAAWKGLRHFRGDSRFSTWLYGLARSRCVDRARRAAVRPALALHSDEQRSDWSTHSDDARRTASAIMAAAAALPLPHRQAVLMRDVQGLAYEEIAALQDVPVGTVRSRIAVARSLIANRVGEA